VISDNWKQQRMPRMCAMREQPSLRRRREAQFLSTPFFENTAWPISSSSKNRQSDVRVVRQNAGRP
jgi:hypothetical protein